MSDTYDRMFDAVDWQLVLYENGKQDYDETIRAIIRSIAEIQTASSMVPHGTSLNSNPE